MRYKLFIFLILLLFILKLQAQRTEITMPPDILKVLIDKSPEDLTIEIENAGFYTSSDKNLLEELNYIKQNFSKKKIFWGYGQSVVLKKNKIAFKASEICAETFALDNLAGSVESIYSQMKDTIIMSANMDFCGDNIYKLTLYDLMNNPYVLLIMLEENIINKKVCGSEIKFMKESIFHSENSNIDFSTQELFIKYTEKDKISKVTNMILTNKGNSSSISLKQRSAEGFFSYEKTNNNEVFDFIPKKNK